MKRLPPIDVLRPGHAHENIVNLARIVSGLRWISDGPNSFECLSSVSAFAGAIVRAREKAEKTLEAKFNIRAFHDAVLERGSVALPVVTARIDRFIAEGGKGPYPDVE